MLDHNHLLSTPGLDVQYFQAPEGNYTFGTIASASINASGLLTVTSGTYSYGQAITITGTFSSGAISGYNSSGTTYYIIKVFSATQITISATPGGVAVSSSAGTLTPGATLTIYPSWQTWIKPRGVKNVYIFGAGGGSSGACGGNTAATNAGGAGGGAGALATVYIPAMFIPDVLYVRAGSGGKPDATLSSLDVQKGGGASYVCVEPSIIPTVNSTLFYANGGQPAVVTSGVASTLSNMPLAGRGMFNSVGSAPSGGAGGTAGSGAGTAVTAATSIILSGGGGGGGGGSTTGGAGGGQSAFTSQHAGYFFLSSYTGGSGGTGSVAAGHGANGYSAPYLLRNYGGAGGGGCSSSSPFAGVAGNGGDGAPGCGGGGGGGASTSLSTLGVPGKGGPGFIYIFSW